MTLHSVLSRLWNESELWNEQQQPENFKRWLLLGISATVSWVIYIATVSVYRLYLHPLAQFSGPRAACLSESWAYNIGKRGFPEKDFERVHEEFNTKALRISPNEIHISDVEQYKTIYNQKSPFPKAATFYDGFNTPHTLFAETDLALHKERRRLMNPLFSRTTILKLEPLVNNKIDITFNKCRSLCKSGPINVYDVFRCLTAEVISEFAFARSAGLIKESEDSFKASFLKGFDAASHGIADFQYSPMFRKFVNLIPRGIAKALNKEVAAIFELIEYAEISLRHFQKNGNQTTHPVVFESLEHLTDAEMISEADDVLAAGSDTTASSMTTVLLNVLQNPEIHNKLVTAIREAIHDREAVPLLELEKIPYLTACIKEGLRLGMAVPGRLPRVVPSGRTPFIVDGKVIPPGTIVSMSTYTMHNSSEIWGPDARFFVPERWLAPEAKSLDQHLCTFSKGARMCIGINVAYAEMTLVLSRLFSDFKLSLPTNFVEPEVEDVFTLHFRDPGLLVQMEPL